MLTPASQAKKLSKQPRLYAQACETDDRIKPGAQAPRLANHYNSKARECGRQLSPISWAHGSFYFSLPGACAPGFMLTPASQAKKLSKQPRLYAQACETDDRIKPGAQAPRLANHYNSKARECGRQLSPISWAHGSFYFSLPGACAPGFMLTPASQAKK